MSENNNTWVPIGKLADELARKLAEKREAAAKKEYRDYVDLINKGEA